MDTETRCFCELAPLYALDLLSDQEKAWVEQQVADCPDLAEELATYQSAATALPYSQPPVPMAADLKDRLFDRLGLEAPVVAPVPKAVPNAHVVRSQDLDWQPNGIPGILIAIVHTDEVKREIAGFLKAAPGTRYPCHRHAATEEIFMMEGELVVGDEVICAGDYLHSSPGSSHAPHTPGGCQFFFRTSMDDEYPELTVNSAN